MCRVALIRSRNPVSVHHSSPEKMDRHTGLPLIQQSSPSRSIEGPVEAQSRFSSEFSAPCRGRDPDAWSIPWVCRSGPKTGSSRPTLALDRLGIDLSNSPRVPSRGTDRRWLYAWKKKSEADDSPPNFAAGRGTQTGLSMSSRSPLGNADLLHPWRSPPYQRKTAIPTI